MKNTLCQVAPNQNDFPFKERALKDANEPHESVLAITFGVARACYIYTHTVWCLYLCISKTSIILSSLLNVFMHIARLFPASFYWLMIWFLTPLIIMTVTREQFSPSDQLDWFSGLKDWEGCNKNVIGMMYCTFIERNKRIMSK